MRIQQCQSNVSIGSIFEHYVKYRNFTHFLGVEILWKGTVSAEFRANRKISTTGN